MEIREQYDDEAGAVAEVIGAAFADGGQVARLWGDVRAAGHDRANLVAHDGSRIIGHVGLSHAWLDARRELVDVLILSPLSVVPDAQGDGTGTALLAAAIRMADTLGAPALFLEGSPAYYGTRGFTRASEAGFEAPSRRTPDPAFQVALLPGHQNWMTGRVIYREVWWAHDAAGLRDPDLAEIERAFGLG